MDTLISDNFDYDLWTQLLNIDRQNCEGAVGCQTFLKFMDGTPYFLDESQQISTTTGRACMKISKDGHLISDSPCSHLAYALCEIPCQDTTPSIPTTCQNDFNSPIPSDYLYLFNKFYKVTESQGTFSSGRSLCESSDSWPVEIKTKSDYNAAMLMKGRYPTYSANMLRANRQLLIYFVDLNSLDDLFIGLRDTSSSVVCSDASCGSYWDSVTESDYASGLTWDRYSIPFT